MNTHNHESVAEEAGLPLLKAAFPIADDPRLGAFYLGNWIADLSQVIDPVAGINLRNKVTEYVDKFFDLFPDWFSAPVGKTLSPEINSEDPDTVEFLRNTLKNELNNFISYIISPDPDDPKGHTAWFKAAQPGVLLKGYFKFVHPTPDHPQPRMDLGAYLKVFDTLFVQYYPHEHMDRPSHPCLLVEYPVSTDASSKQTQYDDRLANGPRSNPVSSESIDLYVYLRDDIEMVASSLTDLDLTWARKFLRGVGSRGLTDDNVEWNLGLARFGHALHAVEDFYAHSNFVEHAAKVMGGKGLSDTESWPRNSRYLKRLKRYNFLNDPDNWQDNDPETHIVTGYFDFFDTIHSVSHLATEAVLGVFEVEPRDLIHDSWTIWQEIKKWINRDTRATQVDNIVEQANKVVRDLLEVVDDPSKLHISNKKNTIVAAIDAAVQASVLGDEQKFIDASKVFLFNVENTPNNVEAFKQVIAHMPLFRDIHKQGNPEDTARILAALFNYVLAMTVTIRGAQLGFNLYKTINSAIELSAGPMAWLKKAVIEEAVMKGVEYTLFYTETGISYATGGERIGCHSLLSKDHGKEVLFEEMKNCATAVHYYIVETMLRWRDPASEGWVDWLDLLEHFTNHPRHGVTCADVVVETTVELAHPLTQQERSGGWAKVLRDFAARYQPLVLKPTGLPFDHTTVLHANCSSRKKGARHEELTEDFVAGLVFPPLAVPLLLKRIIIPYLKHQVVVCDRTKVSPRWYMPVMETGWAKNKTNTANTHEPKFHASRLAAETQRDCGNNLRLLWNDFYRPVMATPVDASRPPRSNCPPLCGPRKCPPLVRPPLCITEAAP